MTYNSLRKWSNSLPNKACIMVINEWAPKALVTLHRCEWFGENTSVPRLWVEDSTSGTMLSAGGFLSRSNDCGSVSMQQPVTFKMLFLFVFCFNYPVLDLWLNYPFWCPSIPVYIQLSLGFWLSVDRVEFPCMISLHRVSNCRLFVV